MSLAIASLLREGKTRAAAKGERVCPAGQALPRPLPHAGGEFG